MPFSQTYPMCCINIRNFVDQFYQFTDGVQQNHLDLDEVLRRVSQIYWASDSPWQ
jgi:hypothetical protein